MTKNADFKRLVRARMEKTGESYAAARAQLVGLPAPKMDEYPDLAGMSDAAVQRRTGKTWVEWVEVLDAAGARDLDHAAIAAHVRGEWPEMGGWWAQTVTVGYERIRGLREIGQLSSGDFAASKSRTFRVPVATLYAAFANEVRQRWIGEPTVMRAAQEHRSMRLTWPDGTIVAAWFIDKGPEKSAVQIQHDKLDSEDRRQLEKERWAERMDALQAWLADRPPA
ncbi:MAG: hypothetical protein AAGA48_15010 [Myxococcota bacterium]